MQILLAVPFFGKYMKLMLVKLTKGQKYASNLSKPKDRRMHFLWAVWNFKVSFNIVYRMLYSFPPGHDNDIFFLIC